MGDLVQIRKILDLVLEACPPDEIADARYGDFVDMEYDGHKKTLTVRIYEDPQDKRDPSKKWVFYFGKRYIESVGRLVEFHGGSPFDEVVARLENIRDNG